jgi:hypothetical protein
MSYKVLNNRTGAVEIVNENDLPTYGLAAPSTQQGLPEQAIRTLFPNVVGGAEKAMTGWGAPARPSAQGDIGKSIQYTVEDLPRFLGAGTAAAGDILPWAIMGLGGAGKNLLSRLAGSLPGRAAMAGATHGLAQPVSPAERLTGGAKEAAIRAIEATPFAALSAGRRLLPLSRLLGAKLEATMARPATVEALDRLRRLIGTPKAPKLEQFQGLVSGEMEPNIKKLLVKEIRATAKTIGGEKLSPIDLYKRLFELRKGAYSVSYDKLVPKANRDFYKQLGRIYSDFLHGEVPGSKELDRLVGMAKTVEAVPEQLKKFYPWFVLYYLIGRPLSQAMESLSEGLQ